MLASTLTAPPQCSQVKMSILNTRFNRCAHVIETRCAGAGSSVASTKYSGRPAPCALRASLRRFKIAPGDFVERLEHDIRGAITVRCFETVANIPLSR